VKTEQILFLKKLQETDTMDCE